MRTKVATKMVGDWVAVCALVAMGCAASGQTSGDAGPCRPNDDACHNAAWQRTAAARSHHEEMKELKRKKKEAWTRQVLAEAKQESRARAQMMAKMNAAQWWCFEGKDGTEAFGECRPSPKECARTRGRRIGAGLREASSCEPYAYAACFNATPSLKESLELFCFPQPELCLQYHDQALARGLYGVTDCGLL